MALSIFLHIYSTRSGADPGFQVRGGALKKIASSGGRREKCWGISYEKSRFYAKKSYYFQLRREARKFLGYFVWKIIFFPILGGVRSPLDPPLITTDTIVLHTPFTSFPYFNIITLLPFFIEMLQYEWLWSGHMIIKEMFYIPIKLKPELARAPMTTSDVNNQWRSNF